MQKRREMQKESLIFLGMTFVFFCLLGFFMTFWLKPFLPKCTTLVRIASHNLKEDTIALKITFIELELSHNFM